MILFQDYSDAAKLAYNDAVIFSTRYLPPRDFFAQDTHMDFELTIARLKLFVLKQTACRIIPDFDLLPVKNFASWLARTKDGKGAIFLFARQMMNWEQTSRMPQRVQKIRSIIHELGHIRLTPKLLISAKPGEITIPASPEEERVAWVYCLNFLAVILGEYSLNSRIQTPIGIDDAPKLFL